MTLLNLIFVHCFQPLGGLITANLILLQLDYYYNQIVTFLLVSHLLKMCEFWQLVGSASVFRVQRSSLPIFGNARHSPTIAFRPCLRKFQEHHRLRFSSFFSSLCDTL